MTHGSLLVAPKPGTPPVGMSATDGRLALAGIFGTTPQLVAGGGISQSGTTMQFTAAQAVFEVADVTNASAAFFSPVDATILTPANGPGTGSRKDLICVQAHNYENGDADSQAAYILVAGAAGTPGVEPAVPAGYFKYATITIPTSASLATSCTVQIWSPTTFGPPELKCPTYAQLITVTGQTSQLASVYADGTASNNGVYLWSGTQWAKLAPTVSVQAFTGAGVGNGATLTGSSFTVPQRPYAQTVTVKFAPSITASGTTTAGVSVTATAGGTVTNGTGLLPVTTSASAYPSIASVAIATGVGTVTIVLAASVSAGTITVGGGNVEYTVFPT